MIASNDRALRMANPKSVFWKCVEIGARRLRRFSVRRFFGAKRRKRRAPGIFKTRSKPEKHLMKKNCFLHVGTLALLPLLPLLPVSSRAAEDWVRYNAVPNSSKVKVDGTSTLHDWSVGSTALGGYVEFDPAFDLAKPALGKVNAHCDVRIFVRQLKSDKTDMDNVMYDSMKERDHRRIDYRLSEMVLKEAPKSPDAPFLFDTKGDLVVAGVTNKVQMPVPMVRVGADKLKFTGSTSAKMTSFSIAPPTKLGLFSTGDDVKITFEWLTAKREQK